MNEILITFVIPCLNERQTISEVVYECQEIGKYIMNYEIIVTDNGSSDQSQVIARSAGAKVINASRKGYGSALLEGIKNAKGKYIIICDADLTYNLKQANEFIEALDQGFDLVIGNRYKGGIQKGAMPLLHFYIGNPLLSYLGRLFFGLKVGDFHCGLRAFRKDAINSLNLQSLGMEFASEMLIKASLLNLNIKEIPTTLRKGVPGRKTHLRTWRDGWRHLKYMLSFAPKFSLLPSSIILFLTSFALIIFYYFQFSIFRGSSTLLLALSSFITSLNIISDYILSREIIYKNYSNRDFLRLDRLNMLLGLNNGTDRLFKCAGISFLISAIFAIRLYFFYLNSNLNSIAAGGNTFLFCLTTVLSISLYLTATKITTFRTLSKN